MKIIMGKFLICNAQNLPEIFVTHIVVAQYNTLSNSCGSPYGGARLESLFRIQDTKKSLVHIVAAQYKAQNSA